MKFIKTVFIYILLGGMSTPCQATLNPDDFTVKVFSRLEKSGAVNFKGSGTLFRNAGKIYVLTSEHVLLHGNEGLIHEVWKLGLENHEATLVSVDYGYGLALLELKGSESQVRSYEALKLPELVDFSDQRPTAKEEVSIAGFPYDSKVMLSSQCKVLTPSNDRHGLPLVESTLLLENGHGEFGMSGGSVFSVNKILGVLSHQFLELVSGKPSQVKNFQVPLAEEHMIRNQLIAIPGDEVVHFLKRYFENPSENQKTFIRRDQNAQIFGISAVLSSGLRFEYNEGTQELAKGGKSGGDGFGIGGGDGFGVGGNVVSFGAGSFIKITSSSQSAPTFWPFQFRDSWRLKTLEKLKRRFVVTVPYFIPSTGDLKKIPFTSLEDFFRKLGDPLLEPVTLYQFEFVESMPAPVKEGANVSLLNIGKDLREKLEILALANKKTAEPLNGIVLLRKIQLIAELLETENWTLIRQSDLELVEKDQNGWKALFNLEGKFDEAKTVSQLLYEVYQLLAEKKIMVSNSQSK